MRIRYWSSDVCSSDLDLAVPTMPWHNQRDSLVELGNWLGLVAGSLGKMAGDILLMCQNEVGELREGAHNGQRGGGSSTLPQKSNPVRSAAVRSEEQPSELQSLMRISYAVFCLK